MTKLSVIIVSYNVKFFLEQCLRSCLKAIQNLDAEILVIDNHSVDVSSEMVARKFPNIKLISRSEERRVGKECRSRWSPDQ